MIALPPRDAYSGFNIGYSGMLYAASTNHTALVYNPLMTIGIHSGMPNLATPVYNQKCDYCGRGKEDKPTCQGCGHPF